MNYFFSLFNSEIIFCQAHDLIQPLWFLHFFFSASHQLNPHFNTHSYNICVCVMRWPQYHATSACMWRLCLLFLQLCKTSCRTRTDIPHMFFCLSDCFVLTVSVLFPLPLPYLSLFYLPSISPLSVSLSDLADNLAMDDFIFQEQLLTPRLATAGVGGVLSPAPPLWKSDLIPTFPVMLTLLLLCGHWPVNFARSPHIFPIQQKLRNGRNVFETSGPNVKFNGSLKELCTTDNATFLIGLARSCFCFNQNHWMFSATHQINPWHCVNRKLALWSTPTMVIRTFVASCLYSSPLSSWLCVITRILS